MASKDYVFSVGEVFLQDGDYYLMAQVGPHEVALIGLNSSANRYHDPVRIKSTESPFCFGMQTAAAAGVHPYSRVGLLGKNASRHPEALGLYLPILLPIVEPRKKHEYRVTYTTSEKHSIVVAGTSGTDAESRARRVLQDKGVRVADVISAEPTDTEEA